MIRNIYLVWGILVCVSLTTALSSGWKLTSSVGSGLSHGSSYGSSRGSSGVWGWGGGK